MAFQPGAFQANAFQGAGSSAGALSGTAAGSSGASASLGLGWALSGTAAGTSSALALLTIPGALGGTAAGTSSATATLIRSWALSGTAAGTSGGIATLWGSWALSGTAAGTSGASATIGSLYTPPGYALIGRQNWAGLWGRQNQVVLAGKQNRFILIGSFNAMPVQNINTFVRGENWLIDFYARDASDNPINLTGLTGAAIQFKIAPNLVAALGSGISIFNALQGLAKINITPAMQVAAGIVAGPYTYEARVTQADGTITSQNWGTFTVTESPF
jgi:hypothetical protein